MAPTDRSDHDRGQISRTAAEIYEEFFVPALFARWTGPVLDAAGVASGQRVLDVACGTGVLARAARERVGPGGEVVGLDPNAGMLAVAARTAPDIAWTEGVAEALPFDDDGFDASTCQFGLMFFEDPVAALREMARVTRPGGRMAAAVWDALEHVPGYAAMEELLARLFGVEAATALRAPFALGDAEELRALFADAGIGSAHLTTRPGTIRFPSIAAWMHTEIRGWTLADAIDDAQYARLLEAAEVELKRFADRDGRVAFPAPAHIVTVTVPDA